MAALFAFFFVLVFVGLFVWLLRYARQQEEAQRERLRRAGFRQETSAAAQAAMKEDFPGIVDEMWLRERNGYIVAFLKEHDSDGPDRPFLTILLEGATPTRPATPTHASLLNVWIIPALLESEGVLFKMVGWAARLSGYPDRLVVPFPHANRWWAHSKTGRQHQFAPDTEVFEALESAPVSVALRGTPLGVRLETQPSRQHPKAPGPEVLLSSGMLRTVDRLAATLLRA